MVINPTLLQTNTVSGFPNQHMTEGEKIKEFGSIEKYGIAMIQAIDNIAFFDGTSRGYGLNDKDNMIENINLIKNGIFDNSRYKSLVNPYGVNTNNKSAFPIDVEHYDIVSNNIAVLMGEFTTRPFNFGVVNKSADGFAVRQEMFSDMLMELYEQKVYKRINDITKIKGVDNPFPQPTNPDDPGITDPEGNYLRSEADIEKYINTKFSDMAEIIGNDTMQFLYHDCELPWLFYQGMEQMIITDHDIYCIEEVHGNPRARLVDPSNFYCDISEKDVDNAAVTAEMQTKTAAETVDEFWDWLKDEDIAEIEKMKGSIFNTGSWGNYDYTHNQGSDTAVRVGRYTWIGYKQIAKVTKINDDDSDEYRIEDSNYKPTKKEQVELKWIPERWEGVRIAENIFIKIRPQPNQYVVNDEYVSCPSNYVGDIGSYSLVDKMKPYQYLYNVAFFNLLLALIRAKGKIILFDIHQLPQTKEWNLQKWMHFLNLHSIMVIDSKAKNARGETSNFNQHQVLDLTLGNVIQSHIANLQLLKSNMAELIGISPARLGNTSTTETLGGIERSVRQSSAITEPLYHRHDRVCRKVLQRLIDKAQQVWPSGKRINYITSDMKRKFFELTDDNFMNAYYGVFVSNNIKDQLELQALKEAAQIALQNQQIALKDWVGVIQSQSIAETKAILEMAEKEATKKQQAIIQQNNQAQTQAAQTVAGAQQQSDAVKFQIEQLRSQTALTIADMNNKTKLEAGDANNNGTLDDVERDKLAFDEQKHADKMALEERKLDKSE